MRSIILGTLLTLSILLNIGTITVTSVATVVSGLFESVTQIGTVLGAAGEGLSLVQARLAKTEGELKAARATNVDLTGELDSANAKIAKLDSEINLQKSKVATLDADLKATKIKNGVLLHEVADLKDEVAVLRAEKIVTYRRKPYLLKDAVSDTSRRISSRTATGASRNLAATFGEAWPVAGVAVVVTATTLELYDACVIMQDLHELDLAFNPEVASDAVAKEVCGMQVPTGEEIWAKIKSSPSEAWRRAKEALPDLPDMPEFSMPEIDWVWN